MKLEFNTPEDQVDHIVNLHVIFLVAEYKRLFEIIENQVDLNPEFSKSVANHFWDLF